MRPNKRLMRLFSNCLFASDAKIGLVCGVSTVAECARMCLYGINKMYICCLELSIKSWLSSVDCSAI